jgi:hypothetical protein
LGAFSADAVNSTSLYYCYQAETCSVAQNKQFSIELFYNQEPGECNQYGSAVLAGLLGFDSRLSEILSNSYSDWLLGPPSLIVQWVWGLFPHGYSCWAMKPTNDHHLVPRSGKVELYLLSPYSFMA